MRALAEAFNREGMTGVKDPGIGQKLWEAYQDVLEDGNLTVRVFALWGTPETVEEARAHAESIASFTKPYESTGDDRVIAGGVKLYADGSGGARTAWLYDDWSESYTGVNEGNRGYPAIDAEILREQIGIYHDAGIHMSVHSIGDRAIDWVMDSYQMAMEANPISGLRHGIIHSNIPTDRALDAMAGLQRDYDAAYPEPSATFMWWIGDTYAGNFGRDRALRLNPFRTFLDKGIRWANGSDYSVTPFAARYGLWASLARKTLLGVYGDQPYGADEAVDIRTALRSHTIWAAHQMFLEDKVGSIEVGKYADIAVWDRDLYTVPVDSLQNLTALMTVFNGRIVYRSPDAPADWPNE
jgi:predicted amidohydrolase YtcJ